MAALVPLVWVSIMNHAFGVSGASGPRECRLPKGAKVIVGCTHSCRDNFAPILNEAAETLGLEYEFLEEMKGASDLDRVDAVLSPGGHDIDPKYFTKNILDPEELKRTLDLNARLANVGSTEAEKIAFAKRDEREFAILGRYRESEKYATLPYLGICYGMQAMAAADGIPIVVDIKEQPPHLEPRRDVDEVTFKPKTVLGELAKTQKILAAENHHQAVDLAYLMRNAKRHRDVEILATSNGGKLLEAIRYKGRPAHGVQYHPERSADDSARLPPFLWLLKAACDRKAVRNPRESAVPFAPETAVKR